MRSRSNSSIERSPSIVAAPGNRNSSHDAISNKNISNSSTGSKPTSVATTNRPNSPVSTSCRGGAENHQTRSRRTTQRPLITRTSRQRVTNPDRRTFDGQTRPCCQPIEVGYTHAAVRKVALCYYFGGSQRSRRGCVVHRSVELALPKVLVRLPRLLAVGESAI